MSNQFSSHVWKPGTQGEKGNLRNLKITSTLIGAYSCALPESELVVYFCS